MMGYTDTIVRKAHICDWCKREIQAEWLARRDKCRMSLIFHSSCAHRRENYFKRLLAQHH
jgi:hypothetical protein